MWLEVFGKNDNNKMLCAMLAFAAEWFSIFADECENKWKQNSFYLFLKYTMGKSRMVHASILGFAVLFKRVNRVWKKKTKTKIVHTHLPYKYKWKYRETIAIYFEKFTLCICSHFHMEYSVHVCGMLCYVWCCVYYVRCAICRFQNRRDR